MVSFETTQDVFAQAMNRIERLVSARERSVYEVYERLSREGFDNEVIEEAITQARTCSLLDDERFADLYIRSKIRSFKGSTGIAYELRQKGIDVETLDAWPDDYNIEEGNEIDRAIEHLLLKPPHAKNKRDAAYRRLVQKGYPTQVAYTAARLWCEGLED